DIFGGTRFQFFADKIYDPDDPSTHYDVPDPIGPIVGKNGQAGGAPLSGVVRNTYRIPLGQLSDGEYFFYAKPIVGPGNDNNVDPLFSNTFVDPDNRGRGTIEHVFVNTSTARQELWTITCIDDT